MSEFLKNVLKKSEFAQHVLTLSTGTAFAQVIPIVLAPLLTRLYTPLDYGILAIYVSIAGLISIVSTGRYELAIVLPKEDNAAAGVAALSLLIALGLSGLCLMVVWILQDDISGWYNEPDIKPWLLLIPLTVLLSGVSQTLNYWLVRQRKFKNVSAGKISDSSLNNAFKVALGYQSAGAGGLIVGNIFGQIIFIFTTSWGLIRDGFLGLLISSISAIGDVARRYSDFLKINTLHAFSDVAQFAIVVFLIAHYFGVEVAGLFGLTIRILKTPMGFIGGAVGQVFFQKAAEKKAAGEDLRFLVSSIALTMATLFLPVLLVLFFFGEDVFSIIFGIEWSLAGRFAAIMSPWFFMNFIISPLSLLPVVMEQQRSFFIISLMSHIAAIAAILLGHFVFDDFESGLILFSGSLSLFSLVILIWFLNLSGKN